MANDSIIKVGLDIPQVLEETPQEKYLLVEKSLSELKNDAFFARKNLGVPSIEELQDLLTTVSLNKEQFNTLKQTIDNYSLEDLIDLVRFLEAESETYVKRDGSRSFTGYLKADNEPKSENHLATSGYVLKKIQEALDKYIYNVLLEIDSSLAGYILSSTVDKKLEDYYTKKLIDNDCQFIKANGSVNFTRPQKGVTPQTSSDLTTKYYVDNKIEKAIDSHLDSGDPHGFNAILATKLGYYIKKRDALDFIKLQTYSRDLLDSLIYKLVENAVNNSVSDYTEHINDKLEYIRQLKYIKQDGSISFTNPQGGVEAKSDNDFTTLKLVKDLVETTESKLESSIASKETTWKTSGPVLTTVGFVEDNTQLPKEMSLLEILDAIFYGEGISVTAPDLVQIGGTINVTVCIQGSLSNFDHGELYLNGYLIKTYTKEDFEDSSCITEIIKNILEETEFVFKAFYTNDTVHEVSSTTKISLPVFVGLLPEWKFASTVSYDYLIELYQSDPLNNRFYDKSNSMRRLEHTYSYRDKERLKIFMAVPADYSNLYQMVSPSLLFDLDSFEVIDLIPFKIPGNEDNKYYKLYIFKEPLVIIENPMTFNFR